MEHLGTRTIETERLILRRFVLADARDMFGHYCSKEKVTEFLSWAPHVGIDETKRYLSDLVLPEYERDTTYRWAIVLKRLDEVIGVIDVCAADERKRCAELGWALDDEYWGRGLMPEAANAVVAFLFSVGYERIQATHHPANKKSGRVMEKIGMTFEGVLKKYSMYKNNELSDCCMWAIVR